MSFLPMFSRHELELAWPPRDADSMKVMTLLVGLQESQWLPPGKLEELQMRQLRRVVATVRDAIPHHAARLAAAGIHKPSQLTAESWRRFPILTKADLQQDPARLTNPSPPAIDLPLVAARTSGSTARPVEVQTTARTRVHRAAMIVRELIWSGWDPRRVLGSIRHDTGKTASYPAGKPLRTWGRPLQGVLRTGPGRLLSIKTPVDQQLEWIEREKIEYLVTYATNAHEIARTCERRGGSAPGLRGVSLLGETVDDETREAIRRVFGVEPRDVYSTNETGYVAFQCPETRNLHVQAETILVEVVDEAGAPCGPGQVGRVLLTTLQNTGMPLFRYEIGDYAQVGEPCPCGRGLPVLTRVMGRTRNMVVLPDGRRHWPVLSGWSMRKAAPSILQHQIVQRNLEEIEAFLVLARPLTPEEDAALVAKLQKVMMHPFRIVLRPVERIERGAGGKFEEFKCLLE